MFRHCFRQLQTLPYRRQSLFSATMRPMRHQSSVVSVQPNTGKMLLIGAGHMATSIIRGLSHTDADMSKIFIYDIDGDKCRSLCTEYGIQYTRELSDAVHDIDMILLAVKPQNLEDVSNSLNEVIPEPPVDTEITLVSILAGCNTELLIDSFPFCKHVVRTMPNTPASVREAITIWYYQLSGNSKKKIPSALKDRVKSLFSSFGEEVEVTNENYLDMGTAISGSGPAYIFLMIEAIVDAGVHLGFPRKVAEKLVISTIRGSASYAKSSEGLLTELRHQVTSPAGTTASALYELEKGNFRTVISDAVWAAYRRSLELGNQSSKVGPGRSKA